MSFIRSCNGKFEDKKNQEMFDENKQLMLKGENMAEDFLFETVNAKVKATDIHYYLIQEMLTQCKANFNLARQAILPLSIDLYEYSIKLINSKEKDMKKQRKLLLPEKKHKPDDPVIAVFQKLTEAMNKSLSILEGKQTMKVLYEYFGTFSDEAIRRELSTTHHIIDKDLLDGLIACRQKYGFFLKQSYESDVRHGQLCKDLNQEKLQQYAERWSSIQTLVTQDMWKHYKEKMKAKSFDLSTFGLFKLDQLPKDIRHKLDNLFSDKFLITDTKLQSSQ